MTALLWCAVSLVMHEMGHLVVAWALGVRIKGLVFDRHGIGIRMERGSPLVLLLSALAGPMTNIVLAGVFRDVTAAWLYNLGMAVLNLLPFAHSDGQRAMEAMRAMGGAHDIGRR